MSKTAISRNWHKINNVILVVPNLISEQPPANGDKRLVPMPHFPPNRLTRSDSSSVSRSTRGKVGGSVPGGAATNVAGRQTIDELCSSSFFDTEKALFHTENWLHIGSFSF